MFVLLTNHWRKRAAALVVALYAFCLMAPVAAFAFSETPSQAHCLTLGDTSLAAAEGHSHHHDAIDHGAPAPATDDHGVPGKCCGLFCVSALAPALELVTEPVAHATAVSLPAVTSLLGRSSNRIDRPPRILPSL